MRTLIKKEIYVTLRTCLLVNSNGPNLLHMLLQCWAYVCLFFCHTCWHALVMYLPLFTSMYLPLFTRVQVCSLMDNFLSWCSLIFDPLITFLMFTPRSCRGSDGALFLVVPLTSLNLLVLIRLKSSWIMSFCLFFSK